MTDHLAEAVGSIPARIGAVHDPADPTRGMLPIVDHICHAGVPRAAAFMMLADIVVGMDLEAAIPDWTFTTDYSLRLATTDIEGPVTGVSRELRHGRRLIVAALDLVDPRGRPVGHSQITFMRTPRREGEDKLDIMAIRDLMASVERPPLGAPLATAAGIEVVDGSAGRVRLIPEDSLRRPGGFVQGSIMTLLGECAAVALAEHHHQGPCALTDLDVRYLIGGRTGPLEATATWLGEPIQGRILVEAVDRGHADVVTTTYLATVRPLHSAS